MKRLIVSSLFALLIFTAPMAHAQDQQVIYVGIPGDQFSYFASPQHNSNWCWAASLQMIFNYYGINITQEQIVARSYGVESNGAIPNSRGDLKIITANLNNQGVDNNGRPYSVRAVFNRGAPDPAYLIQQLSLHRPVLIGYQCGPTSGHAVVVTACTYIQTTYGPIIQSIQVRDPWPGEDNAAKDGLEEYTGIDLANRIRAHWFIVVQ
jgi:peptidase C39-like protein